LIMPSKLPLANGTRQACLDRVSLDYLRTGLLHRRTSLHHQDPVGERQIAGINQGPVILKLQDLIYCSCNRTNSQRIALIERVAANRLKPCCRFPDIAAYTQRPPRKTGSTVPSSSTPSISSSAEPTMKSTWVRLTLAPRATSSSLLSLVPPSMLTG